MNVIKEHMNYIFGMLYKGYIVGLQVLIISYDEYIALDTIKYLDDLKIKFRSYGFKLDLLEGV